MAAAEKSKRNVLLAVAGLSLRMARKYVHPYSHKFSPQKFTQEQLLTCLVLRAYLKTTYRGIIEFLEVSSELRQQLGLTQLPHYSTLKKFADRSDVLLIVDCMLLEVVRQFASDANEAAMDSTGLETTSASAHYQSRSGIARKKFIKVSVCVLAGSLLPSGLAISWGPSNDKAEASDVLAKARLAQRRNVCLPMPDTMRSGCIATVVKSGRWRASSSRRSTAPTAGSTEPIARR
jgi:hypothetical protein